MAYRPTTQGLLLTMRVWDLPTRAFHWTLVLLLIGSYVTIKLDKLSLHMLCGEAIAALLLWRLIWGLIGSDTSRFRHFLHSPIAAIQHLLHFGRREPDTQIGHNAAGGYMVFAMLGMLAAQVSTGLFGRNDDDVVEGPLSKLINADFSAKLMDTHFLIWTLIKLVVIAHILAVIAYAVVKRHNLLRPMLTGKKRLPAATIAPRMAGTPLAAIIAVCAGIAIWLIVTKI